jgi:hypothetical protein
MYVQGDSIGVASYWFDRNPSQSYIFYDPVACPRWFLDDGSMPPLRKYFEKASYDGRTRTFRGQIHWYPATFAGDSSWEYMIVFSDDFKRIAAGTIQTRGVESRLMYYERDLRYRLAVGVGAAPRVLTGAALLAMLCATLPRIKSSARSPLSAASVDLLRRLKDYLV